MNESNVAQWVQDAILVVGLIITAVGGLMLYWMRQIKGDLKDGFDTLHKRVDRTNDALRKHDDESKRVIEVVHRNDEKLTAHLGNGHRHRDGKPD